jgi:thioredoxin
MEVTDSNFEKEVLEESKKMPVLVDFWAPWCAPCQLFKPIIEKLAKEYKKQIKIVKLNIEENRTTAEDYDIMSVPCLKIFRSGQIKDELVGFRSEEDLRIWIEERI